MNQYLLTQSNYRSNKYSFAPQIKALLRDIKSYKTDINMIENLYDTAFNDSILLGDLIRYCNTDAAKHEKILRNHIMFNNISNQKLSQITLQAENTPRENCRRKSRFYWGVMSPEQRTDFINIYILE